MTDSTQTPALSGRELSRARRKEMSHTGSAKIKPAGRINPRKAAKPVVSTVAPTPAPAVASKPQEVPATTTVVEPVASGVMQKSLSGKALSMARRAMLAKGGKSSLPPTPKEVGRTKKSPAVENNVAQPVVAEPAKSEACCDACAESNGQPCADAKVAQSTDDAALDSLCEIIDSNPSAAADASSTVRDICRQRRSSLAKKGKLALPGKAGRQALKSLVRGASGSTMTGKALAKLHRDNQCAIGRGDGAACRPSGRVRASTEAPAKVEEGTTLSGQTVSGTQVEQTDKITGSEAGVCRSVTGTEYLGLEQYENFCSSAPQPAAAKVGISETGRGQILTGSNTAASQKVTGDETGACKSVTGSEYLGAEHFGSVCSSASMNRSAEKVVVGSTPKSQRITGVDEARDNAVTGSESGSGVAVTGSDYADVGLKKTVANAPAKVSLTHTIAGVSVSGGESSGNTSVTGDEQDLCRRVTGTEYISSERFQGACGTAPQASVAKVGVDSSRGGMGITGNLVNRSENVTGNEPGTCQRVTGSQYDSSRSTMCDNRTTKVHAMHTLQGGVLTGTEASPSPKLTGDDRGSCTVVTGSEYVSKEYFQQSCAQVPPARAAMTGSSRTWHNQVISGVQTGHSQKVSGDEYGLCNTITGSNYAAREQTSEFCAPSSVAQSEQRLSQQNEVAMPVSGMTPALDQRMAGGFQRGACQTVSGTPYQGQEDQVLCNSGARHHMVQPEQSVQAPAEVARSYQSGFSVVSPAKAAWDKRANDPVHSSVYAHRSSITGSANKAEGVISGTPEFRHQRDVAPVSPVTAVEPDAQVVDRITGEGRENGTQITGDDWSRGGLVTGTEGLFSAGRNQTQQGTASIARNNIGAHALKDRERPEAALSRVTGGSGNSPTSTAGLVTLSGGASA